MEATKKLTGKSVKKWLGNNAIIVLMLLVSLFVGIIHPNFFAPANLINLFKNVSIRYIIALGISGCLITTGNDLSAGRLAGFAACLACIFAQTEGAAGKFYPNMPTLPTPVVFILVIAICAIVGLCNGLVVSYLKVQPFIATLGMQQVVYGICLVYTGGTPIGSLNKNFTSLASNTILKVPVLIWIALVVAVCFWFLYNKTRHGKYMYAIGGNENAAQVAGVNVTASLIRIYILASCMYALGGFLVGIILHHGEERHVGLAVNFQRVHVFQFNVVAVLVGQGDEVGAEFLAHGRVLLCLYIHSIPESWRKRKWKHSAVSAICRTENRWNGGK